MYVHLNGQLVPAAEASVSVWDGGFLFGDGIYTTLRLYAGCPLDLVAHHRRLSEQALILALPPPPPEAALREAIARLAAANGFTERDGRLRITLTRGGEPGRALPLTDLDRLAPTLLISLVPLPPELPAWQEAGIGVITVAPAYARSNLPELKTLNVLPALLAQRRAAAAGCGEALLTGPGGVLLEGATSNLFLVSAGRLLTPAAGAGLLAGLTRRKILELAAELRLEVREKELDGRHLAAACEVFVVGSVREVVPVVAVDGTPVGDGRPGPVTRRVQQAYRERIAAWRAAER